MWTGFSAAGASGLPLLVPNAKKILGITIGAMQVAVPGGNKETLSVCVGPYALITCFITNPTLCNQRSLSLSIQSSPMWLTSARRHTCTAVGRLPNHAFPGHRPPATLSPKPGPTRPSPPQAGPARAHYGAATGLGSHESSEIYTSFALQVTWLAYTIVLHVLVEHPAEPKDAGLPTIWRTPIIGAYDSTLWSAYKKCRRASSGLLHGSHRAFWLATSRGSTGCSNSADARQNSRSARQSSQKEIFRIYIRRVIRITSKSMYRYVMYNTFR